MKRFGDLFEKACSFESLVAAAYRAARGNPMSPEVALFLRDLEPAVLCLERKLRGDLYRPGRYRTFIIRDPKIRQITVAPFCDRVVHHALCEEMEPILERLYINASYACRKGKGTLRAVKHAQRLCRRYPYFLKLDVRSYFHSIDHDAMCALLGRKFKDRRLLTVLERIIRHPLPNSPPGKGLPIGNLTSQHLANFYLNGFDHFILQELRPGGYVRYMDDLLLFGSSKKFLWECRDSCARYLTDPLKLILKGSATLLAPAGQGLPFLGRRIYPGLVRMRRENLRRSVRRLRRKANYVKSGRLDSESWERSMNSVFAHLRQADSHRDTSPLCRRLTHSMGLDF